MTNLLEEHRKISDREFEMFIDSLPNRIGETPRKIVLKHIHSREAKLLEKIVAWAEENKYQNRIGETVVFFQELRDYLTKI